MQATEFQNQHKPPVGNWHALSSLVKCSDGEGREVNLDRCDAADGTETGKRREVKVQVKAVCEMDDGAGRKRKSQIIALEGKLMGT